MGLMETLVVLIKTGQINIAKHVVNTLQMPLQFGAYKGNYGRRTRILARLWNAMLKL